uniref:Uncharacterized protein n=1 Tax=Fagus sylvatica TaxID=28930 RepID=A0A2N9GAK3_FAGSY
MDFMILIGYPPDPPDHLSIIPIKKKNLSFPPYLTAALSLSFSPLHAAPSQALRITLLRLSSAITLLRLNLSISLLSPHSQRLSLSLPPSVSGSGAYGGHEFLVVPNQVRPHLVRCGSRSGEVSPDLWFLVVPAGDFC